jgi:ubiquitin C-terminal hydrolase
MKPCRWDSCNSCNLREAREGQMFHSKAPKTLVMKVIGVLDDLQPCRNDITIPTDLTLSVQELSGSSDYSYLLTGLIAHHGPDSITGQNAAFVKRSIKWFKADDSSVTE